MADKEADLQKAISVPETPVEICHPSPDNVPHKYSIVTGNILIADAATNTKAQT